MAKLATADSNQPTTDWKVGVSVVEITPSASIWLAGYASRNKPSEGVSSKLFAKCLAFEDKHGSKFAMVTLDLIGIPREMRDHLAKVIHEKHGLPIESLLLNASHTHSGPVVRSGGSVLYTLTPEQATVVDTYNAGLQEKLVALVGKALSDAIPSKLGYNHARCGFAMNRRLPTEKGVQNSPFPDGPVDHIVPVLRVEDPSGKLRAVAFGYACHNTTLGLYEISGDYAGHAQADFEERHPGVTALFVMGCGGDQNPYPRGTIDLAKQHGRSLAIAIDAALLPVAKPVRGPLKSGLLEVDLEFAHPLDREALVALQAGTDQLDQRRATAMLEELAKTGKLRTTYRYPIQTVRFGNDLTLIALAGETVIDFSLRLKRELGQQEPTGKPIWVAGYSNDVFGYVPSRRVLEEGGYEGGGAMRYTKLPGPFAANVEETIVDGVHQLLKQLGN